MDVCRFRPGSSRLLVSIPHAGTFVPRALSDRMTAAALALPDTDWHVEELYDFAAGLGASVLVATHSRYVVDVNRPPDDSSLYPGLATTGICPTLTFDGMAIWKPGEEPGAAEIAVRIAQYWQPYHDRLAQEIDAIRARHGSVVLWDAHSIRSRVPRLFAGELPVLNFGTNDGKSCDEDLAGRLIGHALGHARYTAVLDGRFKGGHITRAYGDPARDVHAVQLELAQRSYMDEKSRAFLPHAAADIRVVLKSLLAIATG
jgi:N-formylglutamate deformylase